MWRCGDLSLCVCTLHTLMLLMEFVLWSCSYSESWIFKRPNLYLAFTNNLMKLFVFCLVLWAIVIALVDSSFLVWVKRLSYYIQQMNVDDRCCCCCGFLLLNFLLFDVRILAFFLSQHFQKKNAMFCWNVFLFLFIFIHSFIHILIYLIGVRLDSKARGAAADCNRSKCTCWLFRVSSIVATGACVSWRSFDCWMYVQQFTKDGNYIRRPDHERGKL